MYSPRKEQRNPISSKNKIKVDGVERKPFVKTGIFPFASIKANTRKDENDYIWSFKFH